MADTPGTWATSFSPANLWFADLIRVRTGTAFAEAAADLESACR